MFQASEGTRFDVVLVRLWIKITRSTILKYINRRDSRFSAENDQPTYVEKLLVW